MPTHQEIAQQEMVANWADELNAVANEAERPIPVRTAISRRLSKLAVGGLPAAYVGLVSAIVTAVSG